MKNKKFWVSVLSLIMAGIMILSLILSILPAVHATGPSSSEIQDQIDQMQKEDAALQKELEAANKRLEELRGEQADNLEDIRVIVEQKSLLDYQVGLIHAQMMNMNEQIAAYNVLIADKQEDVEKAQARLEALNEKYKERIRAMEEDGNISYWSVLFEANNFIDFLDRLNMIQEIAAADSRRLQQLREAATEVEQGQAELVIQREGLAKAKLELDNAKNQLQTKSDEAQVYLAQLIVKMDQMSGLEDQYKDVIYDYEKKLEDLEIAIGKAEVDLDEALYKEYLATMTTAPQTPSYESGSNAGAGVIGTPKVDESGITWLVPCDYRRVSSPFGWREHPTQGGWKHHNGVDFSAACLMHWDGTTDSPIIATREGVVIISEKSSSAGWYVTIDHLDGYRSTYMHMCCKPAVDVGDVVLAGQYIGCIGSTGWSTGDHLHFGIYKNGEPVNPMEYVG